MIPSHEMKRGKKLHSSTMADEKMEKKWSLY
jgi:hypothetical protein